MVKLKTHLKTTFLEKKKVSKNGYPWTPILTDTSIEFIVSIVPNLKISHKETFEINVDEINDLVSKAINKLRHHPSINMTMSKNIFTKNHENIFIKTLSSILRKNFHLN